MKYIIVDFHWFIISKYIPVKLNILGANWGLMFICV